MVSNGLIGCPFIPDLLFKFRLEPMVGCFDTIKNGRDAQKSPPQILVSNGFIGCPFMPDLLFKLLLEPIVGC